jgi:hypothetical protein
MKYWSRPISIACIALAFASCEGTDFRCDPSPSFSYRDEDDAGPRIPDSICRGECAVSTVALGDRHTCAAAGALSEVICFGANDARQSSTAPVDEAPPTWVSQRTQPPDFYRRELAAGALATCALIEGSVVCWGSGEVLGGSSEEGPRLMPFSRAFSIDGGALAFAALEQNEDQDLPGTWYTFGAWTPGQPSAIPSPGVPAPWSIDSRFIRIGGDLAYSTADGDLLAHGGYPRPGLFDPSVLVEAQRFFIDVMSYEVAARWCSSCGIEIGAFHTCMRIDETRFDCAGRNDRGQLGVPPHDVLHLIFEPVLSEPAIAWGNDWCVGGHRDVRVSKGEIVIGEARGGHTCAIDLEGAVWCWGANDRGQLGDGTEIDRSAPVQVMGLPLASEIECGGEHTCVIDAEGSLWCWGDNTYGQLGVPSSSLSMRASPRRIAIE